MHRAALTLAVLYLSASMAAAHPLHSQVTELEWNPESQRYEVAMRLDAPGLEDALSVREKRQIRLEDSNFDTDVLLEYLTDCFEISQVHSSQDHSPNGRIHWAGLELELHSVWLYFEYEPRQQRDTSFESERSRTGKSPTTQTGVTGVGATVRVRNECLMDVRPQSIHSVQLKSAGRTLFGHCDRNSPWVVPRRQSQSLRPQNVGQLLETVRVSVTPSD